MSVFAAEFLGTMLLILLGNGAVANVVLERTKGNNSGLIVIACGWALAVFIGIATVGQYSGAHLNPAVTIGLASAGKLAPERIVIYLIAQCAGAALGATLVWIHYRSHFPETADADAKLAVFCTAPAIRHTLNNVLSEIIGTAVLMLVVLYKVSPDSGLGAVDALPVALTVLAIGLSLGGTTGYAINPARDLMPRLMHQLLPISGKRDSDWSYAWIPVVGPILGALLAVVIFKNLSASP
jgi:glycerol uptake facilitator protein